MNKRIVITGIGVVTPIGIGNTEFTKALKEGKSGVSAIELFDASAYSTRFAASIKNFDPEKFIDKKRLKRMARFTRLGVAAAKIAVEDSGLDTSKEDLSRIGVITGTGIGGLDIIEDESSLAKNNAAFAISETSPSLTRGITEVIACLCPSVNLSVIAVRINPGAIAFTKIFLEANSLAQVFVIAITPPFDAE